MALPPSEAKNYFLQKLSDKAADVSTTDYTVVCCGEEFHVQKLVLSLHSKYFERLFKSGYKVRPSRPRDALHMLILIDRTRRVAKTALNSWTTRSSS